MKVSISGAVNSQMLEALAKAFNDRKRDALTIYFSSEGGEAAVAEAIIDLINENNERVEIVFYGEIFSAGMLIFLRANCKRRLLLNTVGMYHFSWQSVYVAEGGKPTDAYDIFCLEEMKKLKAKTLEHLKTTPLSSKEIAKIRNGKDVYFTYERMCQISNDLNDHKEN